LKLLFLTSRFPYPLEKGDKLRAFELIKHLSAYHEIILFAVNDSDVSEEQLAQLKPYCKLIYWEKISKLNSYLNLAKNFLGYLPFSVAYFLRKTVCFSIQDIIKEHQPDHIFCHLIRMSEYVKDVKHIPKTLDYMDTFSIGMGRMKSTAGWFMQSIINTEHNRLLRYEEVIFDAFEHKIIISEQDRTHIPHKNNDQIKVIPNGVDFDFFIPQQREKKYDLLFAGNMNYPPNIESVLFIANEILPLLRKQKPDIKFLIAGATPAKEILQLQSENIEVTGWVDDIRTCFYESEIMLAPMLISIGLQNKILQAMAMKTPCIVSSLANNAIHAMHQKEVLIADSPEDYVKHILYLLQNKTAANELAENAFQFAKANYDWKNIVANLNAIMVSRR
jgi:sugar transferase (PEP-CTERM/EpsH1 system associated)